jgi:hypothetical protein
MLGLFLPPNFTLSFDYPGLEGTSVQTHKPVSTTLAVLVANLPLVLLIPVVHLDLQISPQSFEKILNDPNAIIRGFGEDDS